MIGSIGGGTILSLLGLKKLFLFGFILASIGSILLTIFSQMDNMEGMTAAMLFIVIFGFAMGYLGCYMSNVLLFPTILKTSSMGFCNFFARIGGILAPLVAELDQPINLVILVISAVLACIASQFIIMPNKHE